MPFKRISHTLASALATDGTATLSYPAEMSKGHFGNGVEHSIAAEQNVYESPVDFTLTFNDANITLTWLASNTLASGTVLDVQLDQPGVEKVYVEDEKTYAEAVEMKVLNINFGTPVEADTDAFIKGATGTELPDASDDDNMTVTYTFPGSASPVDGVSSDGLIDEPFGRNVTMTVTHASAVVECTATVTGKDVYGNTLVETLFVTSGSTSKSDAGVKAFKEVDSVVISATDSGDIQSNTVNIGFGSVIGLPVYLADTVYVLKEWVDGTAVTNGTFVAGAGNTEPSATSADVRGTYSPDSAPDGGTEYEIAILAMDPGFTGRAQYVG